DSRRAARRRRPGSAARAGARRARAALRLRRRPPSRRAGLPTRTRAARPPLRRLHEAPRSPARSAGIPARRFRNRGPSGQDLVDEQLGPLALRRPLLVVARDHLADQAEREELHADDDEENAEREERPPADRVAADLEDRQVDEDPDPADA